MKSKATFTVQYGNKRTGEWFTSHGYALYPAFRGDIVDCLHRIAGKSANVTARIVHDQTGVVVYSA